MTCSFELCCIFRALTARQKEGFLSQVTKCYDPDRMLAMCGTSSHAGEKMSPEID